jgi:preprotein translocase subunit YajC
MIDFSIGDKATHGGIPVTVVFAFSDHACYVETADGTRYRVKKSALEKTAAKPKKEK